MDRSRLLLIFLVLVGVSGGAYEFYDRYQETQRKRIQAAEAARKAAEKAKLEAERKAAAEKAAQERAAAEKALAAQRMASAPGTPREGDLPVPTDVTIGTPKVGVSGGPPKPTPPPARPLVEPPPPPDKPVPLIGAAEKWIRENQLTSTLMGTPRLAVITKKEYLVGQKVTLGGGLAITLQQIEDGYVVFEGEGWHFKMRLRTVNE
ncbi:MAG: hypothetical protein JSR82_07230 [Verrucomicrobia bacterium]|nr:hypothetical protein [Verrucomicrobiota bacterium]